MKCCNCSRDIPENSLYCNWCGKKQLREKEKKLKIPAPRQLPSGSWTVQLHREGVNVTEPTEEACRTKALAIRAGFLEAEKALPRLTLGQLLDKYLEDRPMLSPSTRRSYQCIRNSAFPGCMDKDIRSINWPRAVASESQRVAKKTLKNELGFVAAAYKEQKIPFDPVDLGVVPKADTPWLDYAQILTPSWTRSATLPSSFPRSLRCTLSAARRSSRSARRTSISKPRRSLSPALRSIHPPPNGYAGKRTRAPARSASSPS